MNIKKLLGKRIQEIRKNKKLTQEKVSEFVGIDTRSLSNIETGKYFPSADNLDQIIKILDVEPEVLFSFGHLDSKNNMLDKINFMLNKHPEKIEDVYKITKSLTGI